MLTQSREQLRSVVLIGFESSGKSALFRNLTGQRAGEEANFRGSTITARHGLLTPELQLIDLPGIKEKDDSATTKEAVNAIGGADCVILVIRATHSSLELPKLLEATSLNGKRALLALTFADKLTDKALELTHYYREWLGIPVIAVDARSVMDAERADMFRLFAIARPIRQKGVSLLAPLFQVMSPQSTWFEHRIWGRPLALVAAILLFALPVFLAYLFSTWLQPIVDTNVIGPLKSLFEGAYPWLEALLVGNYGVITLGWYSFLWAFPVVLLLGISVALAEESGMKDRITDSLDVWMKHIGLNGRDLIPVLPVLGAM